MKSRRLIGPLAVAMGLTLVGLPAARAATAAPPQPTCGQTISQSITLTKDLTCSGTALAVSDPYPGTGVPIVLDLGGHTVTTTTPNTTGSSPTIRVIGVAAGTVQNGRVVGAAGGFGSVYDDFATITYKNLVFDGATLNGGSDNATIMNNRFIHGAGIYGSQSTMDIENNTFTNGPSTAIAMNLTMTDSTIRSNTITGYGLGITITFNGSGTNIHGNHVTRVHGDGILIGGCCSSGVPGTISNNVVSNNAGDGIVLADGSGIPINRQSAGLIVSNNMTSNNSYDGIHADATSPATNPQGMNVTLAGNHANSNGHLGIDSPGTSVGPPPVTVTDGRGNTARANRDNAQCLNVLCTKS